jgi:hypothetical protein
MQGAEGLLWCPLVFVLLCACRHCCCMHVGSWQLTLPLVGSLMFGSKWFLFVGHCIARTPSCSLPACLPVCMCDSHAWVLIDASIAHPLAGSTLSTGDGFSGPGRDSTAGEVTSPHRAAAPRPRPAVQGAPTAQAAMAQLHAAAPPAAQPPLVAPTSAGTGVCTLPPAPQLATADELAVHTILGE